MTIHEEQESLLESSLRKTCYHTVETLSRPVSVGSDLVSYQRNGDEGGDYAGSECDPLPSGISTSATQEGLTYTWSELNVIVNTRRQNSWRFWKRSDAPASSRHILNNVFGAARGGEVLAILGPSGAGKSTLLSALAFRLDMSKKGPNGVTLSGRRALNGQAIRDSGTMAALAGYVQQEQTWMGTLTVKEHLTFQAMVRLDRTISNRERNARVQQVIADLSLGSCQNTMIGVHGRVEGISGGELRRLAFASEILTDPAILICDEPTSGLDASMASAVASVLTEMASRGRTVICSIHQPSAALCASFDRLALLAEGRLSFLGSMQQGLDFFASMGLGCPSHYNPADLFLERLADSQAIPSASQIADTFASSSLGITLQMKASGKSWLLDYGLVTKNLSPSVIKTYKVSWFAQLRALLWRAWLAAKKEPLIFRTRLIQVLMLSMLVGMFYYGQNLDQIGVMNMNGAIFTFICTMTFQNVFSVITVFCGELPVFIREHLSGMYRVDVYFLARSIAELPLVAMMPFIFITISYFLVGFVPDFRHYATTFLILFLVANVSTSFGFLISCLCSTTSMALSVGPALIIPFMLFGGFLINVGQISQWLTWLSHLSWFLYANEALLINQWADIDNISCYGATNSTCLSSGQVVLESLSFQQENFSTDILALFTIFLGLRIAAFLTLYFRVKSKKVD